MKTLHLLVLMSILCLVCTIPSYGYGSATVSQDRKQASQTSRTGEERCTIVQCGPAPLSAILEDALAYALDIPLAMASPLTSLFVPPEENCEFQANSKKDHRKGK